MNNATERHVNSWHSWLFLKVLAERVSVGRRPTSVWGVQRHQYGIWHCLVGVGGVRQYMHSNKMIFRFLSVI